MLSPKQQSALSEFSREAVRMERLYGVPAEPVVALAILESNWGLRAPCNFEQRAITLSLSAPYAAMLTKFERGENLPLYAEQVARVLSTDPTYPKQVLAVMSMHPVQDALEAARRGAPRAA
jgi:flagellum-specific peptidoglycan hydrolase FlgJ